MFSVAKAVLLRPLGFEAPDRLMWVRSSDTRTGAAEERLSWREIEDIRESTRSFEALATFGSRQATWDQGDRVEELPALAVTSHLADVLRIRPVLGRGLLPSDAEEAAAAVVLISHELWQARFGGTPDVIGQALRLDREGLHDRGRSTARTSVPAGESAGGWDRQHPDGGAAVLLVSAGRPWR